jgi:WD40-like Beta Propeller Repeat
MVRGLSTIGVMALVALGMAGPASATLPGGNGAILLTEQEGRGVTSESRLIAIAPATGAERVLFECGGLNVPLDPECAGMTPPAVSPDGDLAVVGVLAGAGGGAPRGSLHVLDLDGPGAATSALPSGYVPVTDATGDLDWAGSGEGLSAALWEGATALRNHRLLGLDGTPGAVTAPPDARSLDWSGDGRLAYIRDGDLFVGRPGRRARRLTWRGAADPSWSPHAKRIAFTRRGQIYTLPSSGGPATRLTGRGGERPTWSPDGRKIAFLRARPAKRPSASLFLHVLDPRQRRVRRVGDRGLEPGEAGGAGLPYVSSLVWQPLR